MTTFWLAGHALARLDNGSWHTRCNTTLPDSDEIIDSEPDPACPRCTAELARRAIAAAELARSRNILAAHHDPETR